MDSARFEAIVAAYGADPQRWPDAERDAALAFTSRPDADLADASALDAMLALMPAPPPASDLLLARVLRDATKAQSRNVAPALAALAACMVAGVLVGYGAGAGAPADDGVDWILAAAFDGPDEDWIGDRQ